ncbi:MAG: 3-isopropylmalate dehydratase small subunit [Desulfovibrionaceae bacterium]|jgi:3-isopropylmalate/(R)-2-methylmalate dehydratase small subunit|nr:3-isopropylmalate dehydratase small subunit [Desulfovibrionaceae bacterium]
MLKGRVWTFGDNIDTDVIIPARFMNDPSPENMGAHCMADIAPTFAAEAREGDVLVAGRNFGCGSSREHAPIALIAAGIRCVVAASFARIFYRNAFNMGLPILECEQAHAALAQGDAVEVDLATGRVLCPAKGLTLESRPVPEFMRALVAQGGLIPYTRAKLNLR